MSSYLNNIFYALTSNFEWHKIAKSMVDQTPFAKFPEK